jgi:hypothetical protein
MEGTLKPDRAAGPSVRCPAGGPYRLDPHRGGCRPTGSPSSCPSVTTAVADPVDGGRGGTGRSASATSTLALVHRYSARTNGAARWRRRRHCRPTRRRLLTLLLQLNDRTDHQLTGSHLRGVLPGAPRRFAPRRGHRAGSRPAGGTAQVRAPPGAPRRFAPRRGGCRRHRLPAGALSSF